MRPEERLIVALDVDSENKATALIDKLKDIVKIFKVGSELFTSCGPRMVDIIREEGCEVFLDLKFHDIPKAVAQASKSAAALGVFMFNVHAVGGYEMMRAARKSARAAVKPSGLERPKVLAVTILTSMGENDLKKIGIHGKIEEEVLKLSKMAKGAGLDGVVASPSEASLIRKSLGPDFLIVTPGVRPLSAVKDDQKRTRTPREAIANGADYIVVGRPIIEAKDPAKAARDILKEIEE